MDNRQPAIKIALWSLSWSKEKWITVQFLLNILHNLSKIGKTVNDVPHLGQHKHVNLLDIVTNILLQSTSTLLLLTWRQNLLLWRLFHVLLLDVWWYTIHPYSTNNNQPTGSKRNKIVNYENRQKYRTTILINIVAAFWGMYVSPVKHSYAWLPRKCDYRTDTQTDGQTPDKVILCAAMLCRRHKNCSTLVEHVPYLLSRK